MKKCNCEHWEICPTCYPQGFDEQGVRKPVETPPSREALQREIASIREQLAALAKQNEKMREALIALKKEAESYGETWARCYIADFDQVAVDSKRMRFQLLAIAQERLKAVGEALSLPDLASPVLNKYRAEGMRMAAEICETTFAHGILQLGHRAAISKAIRAKADELENSNV